MTKANRKHLIIVGGGASGIACAITCKQKNPDMEITILEQNERICKKILKTGNGKCNLGNINIVNGCYYNQDFALKKVREFDVAAFFDDIGLLTKVDEQGRMYPYSETATSVVEIIKDKLDRLGVNIRCSFEVLKITKTDKFIIQGVDETIIADYLVIATGSNSQEKTNGYLILENLGHTIKKLSPRLVPIKVQENVKSLQGIRIKCQATIGNYQEKGEILFKENGLSGILTLNISRYVSYNDKISLDLIPEIDEKVLERKISEGLVERDISTILRGMLPKMVALDIMKRATKVEDVAHVIKNYIFTVDTLYGFDSSQVTRGGVDTSEVDDNFASKKINNLYIIGEVLDVDGACGGYNLMFAWMSGKKVGLTI